MIKTMKYFGNELSRRMKEKDITARKLAYRMGVTVQAIYPWMRGEKLPCIDNCFLLCDILECSLDDLFRRVDEDE